jgi:hypothetical protein
MDSFISANLACGGRIANWRRKKKYKRKERFLIVTVAGPHG